jgi:Tol biopolymer transport system component
MSVQPGEKLGPYEILASIGKGGMGEVYRARDMRLGRVVAIKVSREEFTERFTREARSIAALNHTNICHLYDVGPNYLVMEYVEGETLSGPVELHEAMRLIGQLIDGIEAAHEKNIIHRDLKPSNIKITLEGVVKILDFGLAKATDPEADGNPQESPTQTVGATKAGTILGTAAYMAPEQARGKAADKRSDIWSFGVVVYELLTGRRAFEGESVVETLGAVMKSQPDWTPIPARMQRLLHGCLEKDSRKRLQAIGDARLVLEDIPAAPAGIPVPSRLRFGFGWVTAGLMAIIAASGWWIAWRATRPVAHPLMNLSVDLGPDAVLGGNARVAVILSPDGTRLVYRSRGGLSTRLLDQSKSTLLSGTQGGADPFFSPDGQWVGFFADGKLKKISVQGGAAVTLCDVANPHGESWGEGGNIVFAPSPRSGLLRVSETGGRPQSLTQFDQQKGETTHRFPQVLPGGNSVLFTAASSSFEEATVEVVSLKTGQRKTLQRDGFFGRYLPSGHLVYIHQGTLFAAPMDLDKLAVTGPALPLLQDVATNALEGAAQFDISRAPSGPGSFVYVSGSTANKGWSIAWLDGTSKTQPLKAIPAAYVTPSLSPDGKRLAFSLNNDISIYDLQRDTPSRLSFTQNANNYPVWTPDGRGIVYRSFSGGSVGNLYWVRSDGAAAAVRLTESKYDQTPYSFSPDGKRLAFVEQGGATLSDIWTLSIDWSDPEHPKAGQPEVFLRTPATETAPAFSPDGKWVAYMAGQEVYVRPFPANPSGGKWQISSGGGNNYPIWSRNGRELFYQGPDGIMVVSYTAKGATFFPDKPLLWSGHRLYVNPGKNYDLAPDGKRFVVLEPPEGEQKPETHVNLLLNFFDEVRRRVPASK